MRTPTLLAGIAFTALSLTACTSVSSTTKASSDQASSAPATTAATTAAAASSPAADPSKATLEAAVRAYSAAYFKPNPAAAYKLLSKRCAASTAEELYAAELKNAAKSFGHQDLKTVTVDQLSGDMARVSYTYAVPMLNQKSQPWVRENGSWHYDAC